MTGPNTGPSNIGTPRIAITRPSRSGPAARVMMVWASGSIRPPPSPCTIRNAIRLPIDQASPDRADPQVNSTSAVIHTLLVPNLLLAHPDSGMTMPSASRYPVITHWAADSEACRSRLSVSSATFTIVVSRIAMICPQITTRPVTITARSSAGAAAGGCCTAGWPAVTGSPSYRPQGRPVTLALSAVSHPGSGQPEADAPANRDDVKVSRIQPGHLHIAPTAGGRVPRRRRTGVP